MTGPELELELRDAAARKGVPVGAFVAPLSPAPRSFLYQLRHAKRSKPETVDRVRALLEGRLKMPEIQLSFAGGTPGSVNSMTAAHSLSRTLEHKARVETRRHLADLARERRRPGETLAAAVRRVEAELRA
jgi:hypothetical protein